MGSIALVWRGVWVMRRIHFSFLLFGGAKEFFFSLSFFYSYYSYIGCVQGASCIFYIYVVSWIK